MDFLHAMLNFRLRIFSGGLFFGNGSARMMNMFFVLGVFFVFGFTDEDCIWELDREEYQVEYGGRYDRGSPEIKSYSYIPIKYLCDIKNYATQEKISMGSPPTRVSQETPEDEIEPSHEGSIEDLPEERT